MLLSIGIVAYNRPDSLNVLLDSLKYVDFPHPNQVCVLDNNSPGNAVEEVVRSYVDVSYTRLPVNIGFGGGWNVLESIMEGEYRLMMQDDTCFKKREHPFPFHDVIDLMKKTKALFMSISDCGERHDGSLSKGVYSDWPHVEHRDLRKKIGDFISYPRHFASLYEQGGAFESDMARRMIDAGIDFWSYPRLLADHQRKGASWMQTLMHEMPNHLTKTQREELCKAPTMEKFKELGMKVWE